MNIHVLRGDAGSALGNITCLCHTVKESQALIVLLLLCHSQRKQLFLHHIDAMRQLITTTVIHLAAIPAVEILS